MRRRPTPPPFRYNVLGTAALIAPPTLPPLPPRAGTCGDAAGEDADVTNHAIVARGDGVVGRSVAAEYPPCSPNGPVSEVVAPVRTSALIPLSLARGVGVATGSAGAVETPPHLFPASVPLNPPPPLRASVPVALPPARTPASPPKPLSPGVMEAIGRSVAAAYHHLTPVRGYLKWWRR